MANEHTSAEVASIAGRILATIREEGQNLRPDDELVIMRRGTLAWLKLTRQIATIEEIKKCMASLVTQAKDH